MNLYVTRIKFYNKQNMESESEEEPQTPSEVMHHVVGNSNPINENLIRDKLIDFICEKYQIDVAKEYNDFYEQIINKSQICTHKFTDFGTVIHCRLCGLINHCEICLAVLKQQSNHRFRVPTKFKRIICESCHYTMGWDVCFECESPTCFCGCPHGCCC